MTRVRRRKPRGRPAYSSAWGRPAYTPARGRREPERDATSGVIFMQILLCCVLVACSYLAVNSESEVYRETFAQISGWMQEPAHEVFAPKATGDDSGTDFNYNYSDRFFGGFTKQANLPQGGLFAVWGKTLAKQLPAAPAGASFEAFALTFPLYMPVPGQLTSPFGYRDHPVTGEPDFHTGVDLAAPLGTPIRAALGGRVAEIGESSIYGNFVLLDHGGGVTTRYCHCSVIVAREGANLLAGELVARVGATGVATGPHLHFEVMVDMVLMDPQWVLKIPAGLF